MAKAKSNNPHRGGTSLWAFKQMKEFLLPYLFDDLRVVIPDGLEESQCSLIKEILGVIVAESIKNNKNRDPDPVISETWEVFEELRESYYSWNDAETPEERKERLSEMVKLRRKIANRARSEYEVFNNNLAKVGIENVYKASAKAASEHPETFMKLGKAVRMFQKRNRYFSDQIRNVGR